jgi:hypothetical protein
LGTTKVKFIIKYIRSNPNKILKDKILMNENATRSIINKVKRGGIK